MVNPHRRASWLRCYFPFLLVAEPSLLGILQHLVSVKNANSYLFKLGVQNRGISDEKQDRTFVLYFALDPSEDNPEKVHIFQVGL